MRDTVAEMSERAHMISQEAGSKVAAAMKDVISAGAGLAGFAIESARDLVQFMVRRGQMTPEEADKLMREAEDFQSKRKPRSSPASKPAKSESRSASTKPAKTKPAAKAKKPAKPAAKPKPKAKAKTKPKPRSSAKPAKAKKR